MPYIYQRTLVWFLCTAALAGWPVFANDTANASAENALKGEQADNAAAAGLTLDEVIRKALAGSPRLKASGKGIAAALGEERQAGAWSNPEVGYALENFGGGIAYKVISPRQHSYSVSQLIETGGKISAREEIAGKGVEIASLDSQAAALDVVRDVTIAYADVVAAEENVRLAAEQKELAEDVLRSVSVRVRAAAAPLIQRNRAEVERSTATIVLDKANRECDIARRKLAALIGEEQFNLPLDTAAFFAITEPKAVTAGGEIKSNPDIAKINSSLEQAEARLELEKANAIPDPRLSGSIVDIPIANDRAFVIGVSFPIPVFNANRGNIEKARSEISRTELVNRQLVLNVKSELTQAYEQMQSAYVQATTLKTEVLPSASSAFQLAREGYNLGRFPYLEVLDAQRSLFSVKQQQIEAIRAFHAARAQVERLTAAHLADLDDTGEHHAE